MSVPAFSAPPYSGTVFVNENIIKFDDPSSFVKVEAAGKSQRWMYDRRANKARFYGHAIGQQPLLLRIDVKGAFNFDPSSA
ncbi:MAG: hypothetical protein Q8L38_07810 [Pseudohongiella sp.]|nr:hypothetical protein [Pseudohongiella sp.]